MSLAVNSLHFLFVFPQATPKYVIITQPASRSQALNILFTSASAEVNKNQPPAPDCFDCKSCNLTRVRRDHLLLQCCSRLASTCMETTPLPPPSLVRSARFSALGCGGHGGAQVFAQVGRLLCERLYAGYYV